MYLSMENRLDSLLDGMADVFRWAGWGLYFAVWCVVIAASYAVVVGLIVLVWLAVAG